jgi:hypothetical protein
MPTSAAAMILVGLLVFVLGTLVVGVVLLLVGTSRSVEDEYNDELARRLTDRFSLGTSTRRAVSLDSPTIRIPRLPYHEFPDISQPHLVFDQTDEIGLADWYTMQTTDTEPLWRSA